MRRIDEIFTGSLTADMCVAALVEWFDADSAVDPGPTVPLAERLVRLGPSARRPAQRLGHTTMAFGAFADDMVDGERLRLYCGQPGDRRRHGYVVADPDRNQVWERHAGGWTNGAGRPGGAAIPTRVLDVVAELLIENVPTDDASRVSIRWSAPVDPVDELRRHVSVDLTPVAPLALVGPDLWIQLYRGGSTLAVVHALDAASLDAIELAGLSASEGVKVKRRPRRIPASGSRGADRAPDPLPAMLPLTRLGDVEWSSLRSMTGHAGDAPRHLSALGDESADNEVADRAWAFLYGAISHQGTPSEAAPFVVPFLCGLLETRPDVRSQVLDYLRHLVAPWDDCFPEMTPPDAPTAAAVHRCASMVRSLLGSTGDEVTARSCHLLAYLRNEADATLAALGGMRFTPRALPSAILAAGVLGRDRAMGSEVIDLLVAGDHGEAHDVSVAVRWAEAAARCLLNRASRADVTTLVTTVGAAQASGVLDSWGNGHLPFVVRPIVAQLVDWPAADQLDEFLSAPMPEGYDEQQQDNVLAVRHALVARKLLPDGLPGRSESLTPQQLALVDRIVDAGHSQALGLSDVALDRYLEGTFDPTW